MEKVEAPVPEIGGPISRGARVSFGLWILKVKGPTLFLHILNFHCLSFTKRRPKQLSGPLQQSKYTGF